MQTKRERKKKHTMTVQLHNPCISQTKIYQITAHFDIQEPSCPRMMQDFL